MKMTEEHADTICRILEELTGNWQTARHVMLAVRSKEEIAEAIEELSELAGCDPPFDINEN